MLAIAAIVFREFLEIALILSIVMAATGGVAHRNALVQTGIGWGIFGAVLTALFTERIAHAIDGVGRELFDAAIIFVAVGLLSWTVLWMRRHAREMAQNIRAIGAEIAAGTRPLYAIVVIVAVAVLREGSEIVLFSYGMLAAGAISAGDIFLGGVLGALGGTILGLALYRGLLAVAQRHILTVTSWLLIFLAAGLAAQGANLLIAADILPPLAPMLWDSSAFVDGGSLFGQLLGVLIGYTPRPSGMELVFYLSVVLAVGGGYAFLGRTQTAQAAPAN